MESSSRREVVKSTVSDWALAMPDMFDFLSVVVRAGLMFNVLAAGLLLFVSLILLFFVSMSVI